ncbi:MAG: hypothetical protein R3C41_01740 [Calditrichia bacterium]
MKEAFDEFLKDQREQRAIVLTLSFLGGGFLTLWFLKEFLGIATDGILIAMILLPLIIYLVVSGRVSELKTPGGLEAKFKEAAQSNVSAASETVAVEDVQALAEGEMLFKSIVKVRTPDPTKPLVLLLTIGKSDAPYSRENLLNAMDVYEQHRNFKFVVFRDAKETFVCYMMSWAFRGIIDKAALGDEFVALLNSGATGELLRYPNMVNETITTETSNIDALKAMTEKNIEALVVIDPKGMVAGVCEREQVLSKLLLNLAG